VDVVGYGFDNDRMAVEVLKNGRHVGVQLGSQGFGQNGFSVFRTEDDVGVKTGKGLWHRPRF
jgi:hypothetical protein